MPFLVLIIAAVLVVAAIRGTQGKLMAAIRQDAPAFAIWGAAIFGVGMIGFIPGLKPVSRGLLALVILGIVLANWQRLLGAFTGVAYGSQAQAAAGGGGTGATGGGADPGMVGKLLTLVSSIGGGQSADYSDFFGGESVNTNNSAALAAATAADDAAFKSGQRSAMAAAPVEVSEMVIGGANPVKAAASAVVSAVSDFFSGGGGGPLSISGGTLTGDKYGPSPITAEDPLGTAGARLWQQDTFAYEAANLAAAVQSGAISKSDPGYQSKLDYLANLTGGVATSASEMAKLKAMGL